WCLSARRTHGRGEANLDCPLCVAGAVGAVHRLHREAAEIETCEIERIEALLRHDDLQFVARDHDERRTGLRADAPFLHTKEKYVASGLRRSDAASTAGGQGQARRALGEARIAGP